MDMTDQALQPGHDEIGHNGKCNALKRQPEFDGDRCDLPAGWGTLHVGVGACRKHGGSTRNHIRFAEVVEARQYVHLFGGRKDIHPYNALIELVQHKAREVEYWRYRVGLLNEEDLTWGVTKRDGDTVVEEAKANVTLVMLRQAERDLAEYSMAAVKAGVASEMVKTAAREQLKQELLLRIRALADADAAAGRVPELGRATVVEGRVEDPEPS